jgi:hypothetical protein
MKLANSYKSNAYYQYRVIVFFFFTFKMHSLLQKKGQPGRKKKIEELNVTTTAPDADSLVSDSMSGAASPLSVVSVNSSILHCYCYIATLLHCSYVSGHEPKPSEANFTFPITDNATCRHGFGVTTHY